MRINSYHRNGRIFPRTRLRGGFPDKRKRGALAAIFALALSSSIITSGIPTGEYVASPSIALSAVTISCGAVQTDEYVAPYTLTLGVPVVATVGIPTGEFVASPVLAAGSVTAIASGIPTDESVSAYGLTASPVVASTPGGSTGEFVASPSLSASPITAVLSGILSEERVSSPAVALSPVTATITGPVSDEFVASPNIQFFSNVVIVGPPSSEYVAPASVAVPAVAAALPGGVREDLVPAWDVRFPMVSLAGIPTGEFVASPSLSVSPIALRAGPIQTNETVPAWHFSLGAEFQADLYTQGYGVEHLLYAQGFEGPSAGVSQIALAGIPSSEFVAPPRILFSSLIYGADIYTQGYGEGSLLYTQGYETGGVPAPPITPLLIAKRFVFRDPVTRTAGRDPVRKKGGIA